MRDKSRAELKAQLERILAAEGEENGNSNE